MVEPLSADGLRQMSFDTEWTIADVLSHLGSQAEIMDGAFVAIRDGGEAPGRDTMPPVWDRWNAMSPEEQRAANLEVNEAALEHLEALSDEQLAELQLSLFDGFFQVDVEGFTRLRITEHTLHTWDVEVALDPAARLSPTSTDVLMDPAVTAPLVARVGQPKGTPIRLHVHVTEPERQVALLIGEAAALEPWADQDVAGSLRLPAETFLRLLFGRLRDADDVRLEADGVTVEDLRAVFPGY